jgi:hypothetical protein
MLSTDRNRRQNRKVLMLGCSIGLLLTGLGPHALAGHDTTTYTPIAEGSSPTHRANTDHGTGELNIYVGGSLPVGTHLAAFRFLFDSTTGGAGNTTGYLTPLLFEYKSVEAATVYTVVGIAKGFEVSLESTPQTIPFDVIEGVAVPTGANFTFGFVMSLVNSSGVPISTGLGVVDFDTPSDAGEGVAGAGTTNDWAWVGDDINEPSVGLGTTFGLANADYPLGLPYRTYSAEAIGEVPTP